MRYLLLIHLFTLYSNLIGQNFTCIHEYDSILKRDFYCTYTKAPTLNSSYNSINEFIMKNLDLESDSELLDAMQKRTICIFIDSFGAVADTRIIGKNVCSYSNFENKLVDLFKRSGKWIPGICNDVIINCKFCFPIIIN